MSFFPTSIRWTQVTLSVTTAKQAEFLRDVVENDLLQAHVASLHMAQGVRTEERSLNQAEGDSKRNAQSNSIEVNMLTNGKLRRHTAPQVPDQKKTNARTTRFFRQRASSGAL